MSQVQEVLRTSWATKHPLLTEYYDTEWGMPVYDEQGVYERLVLESFQSGLSWLTVLLKREALRDAFDGFQPEEVAQYTDQKIGDLLENPHIIRNRRKIRAAITNARATLSMRNTEWAHLGEFVWEFLPERSPAVETTEELPTSSPESERLASELKRRGFTFVGPKITYAMMAAIGMVDLHTLNSHRRGCSGLWNVDGSRTLG